MVLRSDTEEIKQAVERAFALHSPTDLNSPKFYSPDRIVEDSERFESISFTVDRLFEHLNLLIKQSRKSNSCRLSARLQ